MKTKALPALLVGASVLGLGTFAAVAHACPPNARLTVPAGSAVAGGKVLVVATFTSSENEPAPVEVHWGSATGPVLATREGPNFTVEVTVPQVASGVYAIVATGGSGGNHNPADVIEVVAPGAPVEPSAGLSPQPPAASTQPSPTEQQSSATAPMAQLVTDGTPPRRVESRTPNGRGYTGVAGRQAVGTGSRARTGSSGAVEKAGRLVPAASVATPRQSAKRGARVRDKPRWPAASTSSRRSGDRPGDHPSLASAADELDARSGSRLGIGIGLLALGLVVPLGAFLVADVRRRRAHSRSSS